MNFSRIFYIISILNIFTLAFRDELFIQQTDNKESGILADIIENILLKYFDDDPIYLSIIPLLRNEQPHFIDDFVLELFENHHLKKISHSILDKIDDSVRYKRSFYMIFIDDSSSLL